MTSKITKIGLILAIIGIGTVAAYSVNSFNPVGPSGIILFDLLISFFLTSFFVTITRRSDIANVSN